MSKLTATKLTAFLVHKDNQKFNETIAQRAYYDNHYCGVKPSDGTGICKLKKDQGFSRYLAVNEDNARTIEVRIFAANLRPERVLKNLEFLESLILYCESTSAVYVTSVEQYVAYVASNRKHYRNLWAFMIEKGLLDPIDYPKLGAHKAQKEIKFVPQQLAA
jgi:hypothetical protein